MRCSKRGEEPQDVSRVSLGGTANCLFHVTVTDRDQWLLEMVSLPVP